MPLRGAPLTQGDHSRPLLELQREASLTIPRSLGDPVGWKLPYDWMEEPGRLLRSNGLLLLPLSGWGGGQGGEITKHFVTLTLLLQTTVSALGPSSL